MMFCTRCSNPVPDCECGDIGDRLEQLSQHPNFTTDRCADCAEHAADCTCEEFVLLGGDDA